jgi:hypothetical protein
MKRSARRFQKFVILALTVALSVATTNVAGASAQPALSRSSQQGISDNGTAGPIRI